MVYRALKKDAEIDSEMALVQAAGALDAAGLVAEKLNDAEALLNVAAMWMKFSESVLGFAEHQHGQEENPLAANPKINVGFQRAPVVEPEIIVEEDEDGS